MLDRAGRGFARRRGRGKGLARAVLATAERRIDIGAGEAPRIVEMRHHLAHEGAMEPQGLLAVA
jgi:hypothetical protein